MADELVEHVRRTITVCKPQLVRLPLVETKSTWQGRAAAVTSALQVLDDVITFLKRLTQTVRHSDHQLYGDTLPVPNYPCWIPEKSTPNLDKWTLFPCININSLVPTGAKSSLDHRNIFLTIFFAFIPLFLTTYYIYSQLLLCHYWLYHLSQFSRYYTVATLSFLSHHVVSKYIFFRNYQEYHCSIKRFLSFNSILECVGHTSVVERNLTPTYSYLSRDL